MTENTTARAKTAKSFSNEGTGAGRPMAEGAEAVRGLAQQGAAHTKDMYEKTKVAAEEGTKVLEQTYATAAKGAADFSLQWIEMTRANTNSAFDFARQMTSVKSPSEFLELSVAHARKQFETFSEQAQQLTNLAQKMTTEALQPMQAGVKTAFSKVA